MIKYVMKYVLICDTRFIIKVCVSDRVMFVYLFESLKKVKARDSIVRLNNIVHRSIGIPLLIRHCRAYAFVLKGAATIVKS